MGSCGQFSSLYGAFESLAHIFKEEKTTKVYCHTLVSPGLLLRGFQGGFRLRARPAVRSVQLTMEGMPVSIRIEQIHITGYRAHPDSKAPDSVLSYHGSWDLLNSASWVGRNAARSRIRSVPMVVTGSLGRDCFVRFASVLASDLLNSMLFFGGQADNGTDLRFGSAFDRLNGSAVASCSQRGDETVCLSVWLSRRRSFQGQRFCVRGSCSRRGDETVYLSVLFSSTRSRAEGDSRSAANKVRQHESRSSGEGQRQPRRARRCRRTEAGSCLTRRLAFRTCGQHVI